MADHCLRSTNYINVIVCDKQMHHQYLNMDKAIAHCTKGLGIWAKASNDPGSEPDVVMACAGDIPTKEALAATALLGRSSRTSRSGSSTWWTCSSSSRPPSTRTA